MISIWHSNLVYQFSAISVINRQKSLDWYRFLSIDYSGILGPTVWSSSILPTKDVDCEDIVKAIVQDMGMEINKSDISTGHLLPTLDCARDIRYTLKIIIKFTRRNARIQFYGNRQKVAAGLYQRYCLFTIRYCFIFPQKCMSVLYFLHLLLMA